METQHSHQSSHHHSTLHHPRFYHHHEARHAVDLHDPAYQDALEKTNVESKPKTDKYAREYAQEQGVEMSVYLDYIRNELENESNCLQMPMTILLLLSFCFLATSHLSQQQIYAVEESIEFDISENANFAFAHAMGHKGIIDVNSIADFWSWMRLGFLPLIVQSSWSYSEAYPAALGSFVLWNTSYSQDDLPSKWLFPGYQRAAPVQNDYLRYHKIIGGIRMMQEVVEPADESCIYSSQISPVFRDWFQKPCVPATLAELPPELHETEAFSGIQRVQWLLPELDTMEDMKGTVLDMEDGCHFAIASGAPLSSCGCDWCKKQDPVQPWIDEQTLRVETSFVVFNPVYGLYTYVGVNFFFNRGGAIYKFINVMSFWADETAKPILEQLPMWLADLFWVCANLYVMVTESKEIFGLIRVSKQRFYKTLWEDYFSVWNLIDWVSIIVAILIIQFYITMRLAIGDVTEQLIVMMQHSLNTPARAVAEEANNLFFDLVQSAAEAEKHFRRALSVYPMVVMLRLFKSFKAQKKLALVTDTMFKATQDLLHFAIVFMSIFVCMMVNSVLFFGQDVQEFSSLPRAIHSCFRAMFGDFDWDIMKEIGFLKAGIWFWLFMIVMYLILLNMLLAIIMDAYTNVAEQAKTADPLWKELQKMWRRKMETRRGERVKLNDVYAKFLEEFDGDEKAMLKCNTKVKPEDVCARMNRMPMKQALRTLGASVKRQWDKEEEESQIDEEGMKDVVKELLENVEKRTNIIMQDAEYVRHRLNYYDRLQVKGDPEYDFHFGGHQEGSTEETDLPSAIDAVSADIGNVFVQNMNQIESMQDSLEKQQENLHRLISDMQMMIDQQARCVKSMSDDMDSLGSPRKVLEDEPEAPL
mmetsp:Transcript_15519/g.24574  ORF Transcript_15519/g.24574 Transcript_15519/m.24574 type:complete len:870 (-) Transcript_15519:59-2668(-)